MGKFGAASGGLVQGERFLGLTGPWGRRVLRFDGPMARGLWYRRFAAMSFIECRSAAKPNNRACGDET